MKKFATIRLVMRNFGIGGCDFWEIQERWVFWPFWYCTAWGTQYGRIKKEYDRKVTNKYSKAIFIELERV